MLGIFHGKVCSSLSGNIDKQREKEMNYPKIPPRLLPRGVWDCSPETLGRLNLGNSLEKFGSSRKSKENFFFPECILTLSTTGKFPGKFPFFPSTPGVSRDLMDISDSRTPVPQFPSWKKHI